MAPTSVRAPRRTDALSKDVIVGAATEILDADGEGALTFRALTAKLRTGYGAVYHHVENKGDLLAAATEQVIVAALRERPDGLEPSAALRALALGLFDAIDAHPWAGAQLSQQVWQAPMIDIYEDLSTLLQALGVPEAAMFDAAGVLVNYVLGVAGQNAANARSRAATVGDRETALAEIAARWAQLDPARYPSVRRAGAGLGDHDDRAQFLAGVDLILAGIQAQLQPGGTVGLAGH